MFTDWKRERFIRKTVKRLSRQRVVSILQPGDVWVIERSIKWTDGTAEALRTCHLRGWVEVIAEAVPHGELTAEGKLPPGIFQRIEPSYRLTEAGWNAIHRLHGWVIATFVISLTALVMSILTLLNTQ